MDTQNTHVHASVRVHTEKTEKVSQNTGGISFQLVLLRASLYFLTSLR